MSEGLQPAFDEPTMGFAYIRGQAFVRVADLVAVLKDQGFADVAEWLIASEQGRPVSRKDMQAVVRRA